MVWSHDCIVIGLGVLEFFLAVLKTGFITIGSEAQVVRRMDVHALAVRD
jgi:hypothetical protein